MSTRNDNSQRGVLVSTFHLIAAITFLISGAALTVLYKDGLSSMIWVGVSIMIGWRKIRGSAERLKSRPFLIGMALILVICNIPLIVAPDFAMGRYVARLRANLNFFVILYLIAFAIANVLKAKRANLYEPAPFDSDH